MGQYGACGDAEEMNKRIRAQKEVELERQRDGAVEKALRYNKLLGELEREIERLREELEGKEQAFKGLHYNYVRVFDENERLRRKLGRQIEESDSSEGEV